MGLLATIVSRRQGSIKRLLGIVLSLLTILALTAACGVRDQTAQRAPDSRDPLAPAARGGPYAGGTATGDTDEGAAFARWVLEQDPQHKYITDAVVRNQQTLGVKVTPTATKAEVHELLTALAEGMARTFPGKPLTINAFYQSGDKLAEAQYDPRLRRVDVNFLQ